MKLREKYTIFSRVLVHSTLNDQELKNLLKYWKNILKDRPDNTLAKQEIKVIEIKLQKRNIIA